MRAPQLYRASSPPGPRLRAGPLDPRRARALVPTTWRPPAGFRPEATNRTNVLRSGAGAIENQP